MVGSGFTGKGEGTAI